MYFGHLVSLFGLVWFLLNGVGRWVFKRFFGFCYCVSGLVEGFYKLEAVFWVSSVVVLVLFWCLRVGVFDVFLYLWFVGVFVRHPELLSSVESIVSCSLLLRVINMFEAISCVLVLGDVIRNVLHS